MGSNDEYIAKSSARVILLLDNIWLSRYLHSKKFVLENRSEFKWDFTPLSKDFDIKPVLITIKNPQDNAPVKWVHQVMLNMIVTKDLANKFFEYIYSWG